MHDPLAGSNWSAASTVHGFSQSPPNDTLMALAGRERARWPHPRAIDIGCGAARNLLPLARQGWHVLGTDWSRPMLDAAVGRVAEAGLSAMTELALAPMTDLPAADASCDLIIAHGIWNLARSAAEFRQGVAEAARVARPGAALFVFTFSRHTLPTDAAPVAGETFVFTQFSGQPQCFLTETQLLDELAAAGFSRDPAVPLSEYNLPRPGALRTGKVPVIYEAAFRRTG